MKKYAPVALAAILIILVVLLVVFFPSESADSQTVTQEQWENAMDEDSFTNVCLDFYEEFQLTDSGEKDWIIFHEEIDSEWIHITASADGETLDVVISHEEALEEPDILAPSEISNYIQAITEAYSQFTYDEDAKSYLCSDFMGAPARVAFENGKLVSLIVMEGTEDEMQLYFSRYGEVDVNASAN